MKFLTQKRLRKGPFLYTVHISSGENLPDLNAIVINRAVEARKLKLFPNPDRDKVMLGLSNDIIRIMVVTSWGG
ncbi:MAG: hypothetical protein M9926_03060 [Lentimicrobium sp.]|jgi:hypothetical protein|uniref:hypothetical protein n=1 Tax=Lentimicrobium sp. TaxID=2034841 RepID=UPI0025DBDE41|nr:hypothetical protein [Lentimicrobium sp.]MCO5255714.1 hypothetical protein [Lentimicrobium sp.]